VVERWRVLRLDDNDQRYLVTECSSEAEAQRIAAEYTAKGHKQCYWVERVNSADNAGSESPEATRR